MENQLVTILRIARPQLGSFVKNRFEAEGIECFFTNEGITLGSEYNPDEVLLKVKLNQSEEAVKILLQIHKDYDLDKIKEDVSYQKLKKILVPVKLIDDCIDISIYAMKLAKKINAEIKLLYVYPNPIVIENVKHTASWEKHVKLELLEAHNKAEIKLVEFSDTLKRQIPKDLFEAVQVHYRMLKGTPVNVITDACKRYEPDLILMGITQSLKKSSDFLEKTILNVIDRSDYPVLAVPCSVISKEISTTRIMYATDFYEEENYSLNKLLKILQPLQKEIYCVHIDLKFDQQHRRKVAELNRMLTEEYSDQNIHCELFESKNITQGFYDFVDKNSIDLISFSKIKRSAFYKMFHSSHLDKLVSSDKVPVLIFPV
ncbi:MAG: hypothetical protein GQ525_10985 [Draconibacterium sp.]|nr:hypothetical protein [Draconibacterium sp.]